MTGPTSPAHPSRIEVCGRAFTVRRSHDLALRLEERFGPIGPLLERARSLRLGMADIRDLLAELLAGQRDAPAAAELDAWIFQAGVQRAAIPAVKVTMALFIGCAEADRLEAQEDDEDEEAGEPIADPPRASSAGTGSSAPRTPSDGGPPSSGAPPSSNSARRSPRSAA